MFVKSACSLVALSGLLLPTFGRAEDKPAEAGKADPKLEVVEISKSPADEKQLTGIETWTWTGQGSANGVDVKHAAIKEQPANTVLVVDYLGGRTEKATAKCVTDLALDPQGKLSARVFCNEKDLPKVAFAVSTGETFAWQESEPVVLKEGWNEVEAKLGDKKWKSEATKWKHDAEAKGLDDVRAILLLVFNGKHGGILYVDALHVDRDPKLDQELRDLTKKLGAEDFEAREGAGKRLAEIGRKALPYLRNAAEGTDPEVAQRAKKVMEAIQTPKPVDVSQANPNVEKRMEEIRKKKQELKKRIGGDAVGEMPQTGKKPADPAVGEEPQDKQKQPEPAVGENAKSEAKTTAPAEKKKNAVKGEE